LSILKQVAAIKETGEVLLHTGNCLAKGGDLIGALDAYEKAEDRARTEKDKATQQALVAKLADLRARIPAVSIQLPDDVKDVAVKIDGEDVEIGRLAKPIPLSPGDHEIAASAPRRKPFSKKLTLAEKDTTVVALELPREDEPEGSGAPVGDDRPKRAKAPDVPLATWIAGSAALVLTAGGFVAFVAAGSAASDGEDQCAKQAKCDDSQKDTVHQLDAAALGMWIGAGIGAGVAITFYALSRREAPQDRGGPAARRPSRRGPARPVLSSPFALSGRKPRPAGSRLRAAGLRSLCDS
jgi:hypothetical protein